MSLAEEARRTTEYTLRRREKIVKDKAQALTDLRATSEWRQAQTERGNGVLAVLPKLIEQRANDGHVSAWVMDIDPEQYVDLETQPAEFPIEAVQAKLHGAARIVAEYLIQEGFRVFIRHKGCLNGVHRHQMEARWS